MATADELRSKVASLRAELRAAEQQLHEAIIAESPVKVGQIFTREKTRGYGSNRKTVTERAQVSGFERSWGATRAVLKLFNKDGTLGLRAASLTGEWSRE